MKNPMLEQALFFLILSNFYMMISCFKLLRTYDSNRFFIEKLKNRINSGGIFWKFLFYLFKNI
jgi:hypothetical protein